MLSKTRMVPLILTGASLPVGGGGITTYHTVVFPGTLSAPVNKFTGKTYAIAADPEQDL